MAQQDSLNGNFNGKDILSLDQFSKSDIKILFKHTPKMKQIAIKQQPSDLLKGTITSLLFYEPSSRTFGSFCAAVQRLGSGIIPIQDAKNVSSVVKGETLKDTIQTLQSYSDIIIMRHPDVGSVNKAADAADIPVINAGDGKGEHPTQALLDLYTIYERHKRLDNLTILIAGDLLNGRTVHSLLKGLSLYKGNKVYLLSPNSLKLSQEELDTTRKKGIELNEIESEKDIPKNADVWYWTRVQKERFSNASEYNKVKNKFIVTKDLLSKHGSDHMILMHPLPRVGEISEEVDADSRAVYMRHQMRNGMYLRMALIALVLGKL